MATTTGGFTAGVRLFATRWWDLRPGLVETLITLGLAVLATVWFGWPSWTALPLWAGVQVVAMAVYAAYLIGTGRPAPRDTAEAGESDG